VFRISVFLFLLFASMGTIIFYLPLYLKHVGLSSAQVGAVLAAGTMAAVVSGPFWSFVSDKRKTVKRVLLALLAVSLLAGIGVLSVASFPLALLTYALLMFFYGALLPLADTLSLALAKATGKDFGRMRMWGEIGIGISALVSGLLIERVGIGNLWALFATSVLLALAAGWKLRDAEPDSAPVDLAGIGRLLSNPKFLLFLLPVFLVGMPHRANDSLLGLYLSELGGTESQLGMAWILATLSSVPALFLVGKAIRRWNEQAVFLTGSFLYALRWAVFSLAGDPDALMLAQLMHSLSFPLFFISSVQYLYAMTPPHLRASGQAALAMTLGLGGAIGSAGGGALIEAFGGSVAYGAGAVVAFAGAAIAAFIWGRMDRRTSLTASSGTEARSSGYAPK